MPAYGANRGRQMSLTVIGGRGKSAACEFVEHDYRIQGVNACCGKS